MKKSVKQHNRKQDLKKSLLPWIIICGAIALILGGVGIYTWLSAEEEWNTEWLVYKDGTYIDEERGITYQPAPFCFEAVSNASEDYPYAKSERWPLYQIGYKNQTDGKYHFRPATEWLTTAKSVGGQIYYNPDAVKIPTYAEFDWNQIFFSNPGATTFSTYSLSGSDVDRFMQEMLAEDNENIFGTQKFNDLEVKLTLRVSSKTYLWLYLNLTVYSDGEGNFYVSPEGVNILDDPFVVKVDASYFEDYLKSLEDILNSQS